MPMRAISDPVRAPGHVAKKGRNKCGSINDPRNGGGCGMPTAAAEESAADISLWCDCDCGCSPGPYAVQTLTVDQPLDEQLSIIRTR